MAKKLIRLYEQDTTDFSNNGLKILSPMSAKITRNLIEYTYQLELTHLLDEKGMMLTEERILGYNGQYFRISSIRRNLKEVSIIAKHIFFDLNKNFIEDINIKNKTGSMALSHILGGTSYPHSFSATSDIDTVASSRLVRKNVVSALIGDTDNSFINRWGGELDIDGFTFKLNEQIGKDDGYTIQYGKNLTGLDLQLNMLEVVTRIRPVGFDGVEIDGLYVDSPYIDNYALPIIKEIKYENVKWKGSPNYEEREDDDSYIYDNLAEAQAKLVELATNEFVVNEIDLPKTTINIEFIELSKTEEYKHLKFLQNINIGDTVHIYHKPLDINLKSRCIEYVYDCILNKYETITLGSYTKNFFTKTQNTNNTLDNGELDVKFSGMVNGILQQTQKHLNDTITQAMGGYVYKTNNALYIMDTDDISTAQKIWVWNKNGLAYSSTGIDGPYTTGITMDGHIVGSMISANSITGEQIQANSIKTANLELSAQQKIQNATDEETVKALIKADLDGFESTLSKEFITVENATTQIQQTTEVAVKEATQSIIDNAVTESMGAVNGQLNDKLNQYTGNTLLPAIAEKAEEVLQNAEDYVVTKLESYATKQELSSSISQTREQIELSVSEKYTTKTESATIITDAINTASTDATNKVNSAKTELNTAIGKKANSVDVYTKSEVYTKAQTDSAIKVAKDEINLGVSSTYETKTNVETKVSSTLNSAKSYADTKKTEAINTASSDATNKANNAKNEAINSANNTLTTTIANYYTKAQTDSQINVAKNAITSSVSSTYATKTDVTSSINGVNSSISNLQNRMNNAEQKITDTAITNVVKQNFYTKSETDKQITSKRYQTSSQVQQTVDNLQIKFSQSGGYNLIRNSTGYNGTNLWTGTATLGTSTNSTIGSACDKYMYLDNGTTTSERFAYSSRFKLKPSTTYTLTGWFHNYTKCPSFDVYVLSSTSVDSSNTDLSHTHVHHLIQEQNTNGAWKKYTASFTTPSGCKSGIVRIDNNGYNPNGSNSNRIHWSALILTEGTLEVPWSPHPDEVYDGLTSIDKEGITVTASNVRSKTKMSADGFQLIRTTDNKKMFYVNQDGSLEMSGNFTQHDSNGKISVKIANNSYGCYDWLWDGDYVGKLTAFETTRTNAAGGANHRFIGIANIADYGNQLVLGVRSDINSEKFNSYVEIDNTGAMHLDYVTFTANTGFKTNALFRNPNSNYETGRIFGATNNHLYVACNYGNQLRLGYEKNGSYYYAMSVYRNDNTSAGCAIEYYADEVHHNNVVIEGFLSVRGQKNRLVATENFGDRLLNAYETAECYFGDINEAIIGEDGEVKVELDEVFLETVNTTEPYQVFLTKYGEGDCYVSERHEKYFVIKGTPNLSVGFEVKAKQRGYEKERLKMAVDTLKSHQATSCSPCSEDEVGYTIDCETTINRG